jgi:hypothetical protein
VKAILEFNLPEEQAELETAAAATKLSLVVDDIKNALRTKLKYGEFRGKEYAAYENIQKELFAALEEHGVSNLF